MPVNARSVRGDNMSLKKVQGILQRNPDSNSSQGNDYNSALAPVEKRLQFNEFTREKQRLPGHAERKLDVGLGIGCSFSFLPR